MDNPQVSRSGPDPFRTALVAAILGVGLVTAAVLRGWLGPNTGAASEFCEAFRDGYLAQPANALSNLGFVVAGLAIGWRARRLTPPPMNGMVAVYAATVVLLGPGSAAMHATGSRIGGQLDLASMFLVASFAAAWGLKRLLNFGNAGFLGLYAAFFVAAEFVFNFGGHVPVVNHAGNAAFALLLVIALVTESIMWTRHKDRTVIRAGAVAVGALLGSFAVWKAEQITWCNPDSLFQGHAIWHLGCAVAAYALYEVYRAAEKAEAKTV